jgi:hypothetical protein
MNQSMKTAMDWQWKAQPRIFRGAGEAEVAGAGERDHAGEQSSCRATRPVYAPEGSIEGLPAQ